MCSIPEQGLWSHEMSVHYDAPCPLQFQSHCSAAQQAPQALLWIAPRWRVLPCQGELCGCCNTWEMHTVDFQQVNKWPQHRGVLVANLTSKKHNILGSQYFHSEIQDAVDEIPELYLMWESMFILLMWSYLNFFDKVLTPSQSVPKPRLSYEGVIVLTSQKR